MSKEPGALHDLQLAGLQQFRKRELHWSKRLPDFLRFVLFPSAHRQLTQTSQPKQLRRRRAVPSGVYTSPSRPPIPDQFQSGRRAASHDGSRPDSTTTCFIASANNSSIFEGVGFKHVHDKAVNFWTISIAFIVLTGRSDIINISVIVLSSLFDKVESSLCANLGDVPISVEIRGAGIAGC